MFFDHHQLTPTRMNSPLLVTHVTDAAKSHLIAQQIKTHQRPTLIVTHSPLRAKELQADIGFFLGQQGGEASEQLVSHYPAKDIIFFSADVRSGNITRERFSVLRRLVDEPTAPSETGSHLPPVVVLTIEALYDKLTPREAFMPFMTPINLGDEISVEGLVDKLVKMGYHRREQVEAEGHFALRGGILDVYTPASHQGSDDMERGAYRLEFFGDEVDSIRTLDTTTQRSLNKVGSLTLFPVRELVYTAETLAVALAVLAKDYQKQLDFFVKKGQQEEADKLREHVGETLAILRQSGTAKNIDNFFAYFYDGVSLLDYFPADGCIYFDEPNKIKAHASAVFTEFNMSNTSRLSQGYLLPNQSQMFFSYDGLLRIMANYNTMLLMTLPGSPYGFSPRTMAKIPTREVSLVRHSIENLAEEIRFQNNQGASVVVLAAAKSKAERLATELSGYDIAIHYASGFESLMSRTESSMTNVTVAGSISRGFEYLEHKVVFISDKEVFAKTKRPIRRKKSARIENFADLKPGDHIVHDIHGIGVYSGLETLITDNVSRDYLQLTYKDGGKIYVPTTQVDRIQKYIGGSNAALSKLGGTAWEKTKTKAKEAVAELARELALLYAQRKEARGYEYTPDTIWQTEFEDSFPFDETNDQLLAIEDVKSDMESTKVMDRLICGDVGFGKTEVAIRAAFKAAQDGKQVAMLVPTTILAQQHWHNFKERMRSFPVNVEVLSRFRTKKEQNETLFRVQTGACDIIIGTHRLLSKDVKFKNLGLVIVDEEQRFGVTHKEKLKHLTVNVDVLTLSATPIPRTLHMSLSGIRDISLLQDPPTSRKNIQTFVLEYDKEFVKTAVTRELARGGQVYYLYNNVRNIGNMAQTIATIVPDARVRFAHGQMSETELETVMMAFIDREIDVLVCTTIIETGLDIPNVNTIVIHDADHMGLSQLYQLRGRVGRSDRIAYAYLMYKKDKLLNEIASRRLQTIRDFTEFGSGFKVALKDLEIRGVGNLLGASQSGHMATIGYEMYSRLLEEAVRELEGKPVEKQRDVSVEIKISAYIPPTYISNEEQRLYIYKKIAHMRHQQDHDAIYEEIEDKYGELPKSVDNLLQVALLKGVAASLGATEIIQKEQRHGPMVSQVLVVMFDPQATVDPEKITQVVSSSQNLLFTVAAAPYLTYKPQANVTVAELVALRKILESLS